MLSIRSFGSLKDVFENIRVNEKANLIANSRGEKNSSDILNQRLLKISNLSVLSTTNIINPDLS